MEMGARLPESTAVDAATFGRLAEASGYGTVWAGELWGADAFVRLADVAAHTEDAGVGTAIANVFSRSPAVLAMAAANLDDLADGGMRLGVGPSTPTAIEDLHGLAYERPLGRVREAVEIVDRLTGGGDPVSYEGELFSVRDVPPLDPEVPVYNAALGPANRRLTGRFCDGWIPHNVPFPDLEEAFEAVADGARRAGRDPGSVTVAPYVPVAVADGDAEARAIMRAHVAYYAGSGEGYRRAIARRFPEAAERIGEAWEAGDREAARDAVTDGMVDDLGVAATPAAARERLEDLLPAVVDEAIVVVAGTPDEERVRDTLAATAPG